MAHENDWVADVTGTQQETWIKKTWSGVSSLYGSDIWHDGNNTYYSHGTSGQYVLDTTTDTWVAKTWTGFKNVYAKYVWTDGTDIYCSLNSTTQYVLDRSTSTWVAKTWGGTNIGSGEYAWSDGENTYYSYNDKQLVLNKQTSTWENKTWNGLTSLDGSYVWTDGTDIYYSYDNDQYVLDKSTSTWTQMTWNGLNSFRGKYIWFDSGNIYYSYATNSQHYQLDKSTNTWIPKTWDGMRNPNGANIWHYKNKTYHSYNRTNMELRNARKITSTPYRLNFQELKESVDPHEIWVTELDPDAPKSDITFDPNYRYVKLEFDVNITADNDNSPFLQATTDLPNPYMQVSRGYYWYQWSITLLPATSVASRLYAAEESATNLSDFMTHVDTYGSSVEARNSYPAIDLSMSPKKLQYTSIGDLDITGSIYSAVTNISQYNDQNLDEYYRSYVGYTVYLNQTATGSSSSTVTVKLYYCFDQDESGYDALLAEYPNHASPYNPVPPTKVPYRLDFPEMVESIDINSWVIDDDIPYRLNFPELKESFNVGGEWLTKDEPDTSSTKKYLKFTHTITATFTAGNRVPTITYDFSDSEYYTVPRYWDQGVSSWSNIYGRIFVPANAKVRKDEWDLSNTDIYGIMDPNGPNYFKKLDGYNASIDPTSDELHYDSGDYYWAYPSRDYGTNKYYIEFSLAMLRQLTPSESGSTTITFSHIFEFDSENEDYRAFLEAYPNNVEPWYPMVKAVPYRLDFPELHKSLPGGDIWIIDDEYPYRVDFPALKESSGAFTGWLQNTGYSPYRPWPNHRTIFQSAEPIEIPEIDWTKGMQQTFEYFKVNPSTWNDYEQITTVISSNITKDTDSEMRGHASIETTEPLDECYIRTYMAVRQNGIKQRICLGTHLYMVQSDSFNGMNHQYNYTGYTPLVELREKLIPLGYSVTGVTGEINGKVAPMLSDEIATLIRQNSRVKLENRVKVEEPLLNNFVAGTTDNILTVVNNLLNASSLQQYQVTVDEFGTVCIKEAISVYNERHVFEYTDDNSSILMADIDLASDLSSIPNVLEVIYAGDANKDIGAVRVVVRNEDPNSIVSTVSRGREVWNRVVISNIGSPYDKSEITRQVVVDQVTNQAYRLLEDASTIRKTIQYEHGYCDVEVGDTVLFNYKRAGLIGIKAKVVSQTIICKPGCKVSEMAVYTKKLWNRGV